MKTFDTLYKRTRTGAIQFWKIHTTYHEQNGVYIVKQSGQLGTTSPITNSEYIRTGKNIGKANETTPMQQALLQAESDWKKKRYEGYKSKDDLGIRHVGLGYITVNDGQIVRTLEAVLQESLPQFNTDANGNVKPMLAKDWAGGKKVKYPCYIQPKLDGVRCLMVVQDGQVTFLSRSGKEYTTLDHIAADVRKAFANQFDTFILDGEIYSDELTFQEITQAVKKQYPNSLKLHFRAYDIVNEKKQLHREQDVFNLVQAIASSFVTKVETYICHTGDNTEVTGAKWYHDTWVRSGYEGAMLRQYNGIYAQGQRSSDLLKVKEFNSEEFVCYGFETGQREEDLIALCKTNDGQDFKAKMVGSAIIKKTLQENTQFPSKLTVKFFGYTDTGNIRFPIGVGFRDYE